MSRRHLPNLAITFLIWQVVERVLKTSVAAAVELNTAKNLIGSAIAGGRMAWTNEARRKCTSKINKTIRRDYKTIRRDYKTIRRDYKTIAAQAHSVALTRTRRISSPRSSSRLGRSTCLIRNVGRTTCLIRKVGGLAHLLNKEGGGQMREVIHDRDSIPESTFT